MIGEPIALRIRRNIRRPNQTQIEAFRGVQSSFVADAQQGLNCLHCSIRPMVSAQSFVGCAVTASGGPRDLLAAMALLDVVQVGDVAVIATGGDESAAVFGDIWTAAAQRKGVIAAVTDGLVRDTAGIEELGVPVFARGTSPNSGHQNGPGEINCPVSVGGMTISPGDIILGDRDGVVVIPLEQANDVAAKLAQVVANEAEAERLLAAGELEKLWDEEFFQGRGVHYLD